MEPHDPHMNILLDIQKQLGVLGAETARQSEVLSSIDGQVKKTNGRVTALEIKDQERRESEANFNGKIAVIGSIAGVVATAIFSWVQKNFL